MLLGLIYLKMLLELNVRQVEIISGYFVDISKILFASTVIGFFVPTETGLITIPVFFGGLIVAIGFLIFSLHVTRKNYLA